MAKKDDNEGYACHGRLKDVPQPCHTVRSGTVWHG